MRMRNSWGGGEERIGGVEVEEVERGGQGRAGRLGMCEHFFSTDFFFFFLFFWRFRTKVASADI